MRLSPEIKPKAKLEERKLAFDWKAKMIAETENYLAILGFLLLVGAYGLASSFDKYELESLCHTVAQDENAYQNFWVLQVILLIRIHMWPVLCGTFIIVEY